MPFTTRSWIGVRRERDNGERVAEYSTMATATRAIAGDALMEIPDAECRRIRAELRAMPQGHRVRDSRGYFWRAIYGSVNQGTAPRTRRATSSPVAAAVAETFPVVAWSDLTFGVELELVLATDHSAQRNGLGAIDYAKAIITGLGATSWKVVYDGSVSGGCEVVSPVLKGEAGIAEVTRVCDALKSAGFTANTTCGMHVHVGARQFSVAQLARVCAAFKANESYFDSIVAPSRRNNRYAQGHSTMTVPTRANSVAELARRFNGGWNDRQHYTPYRYRKLNLQSYACHGTFEFRQHQGTAEAERATGWIRLITGFFAHAVSGNDVAVDFAQFAALAGDRAEFIVARRARFARDMAIAA